MPMAQANRKALNTLPAEIRMCTQSAEPVNPSLQMFKNFTTILCGEGTNSGLTQPIAVINHQKKSSIAIVVKLSNTVFPEPGTP